MHLKRRAMVLFLDQADYEKHPDVPLDKLLNFLRIRAATACFLHGI